MKVLVLGASGMLAKPVIGHMDKAGFQLRLFSRTVNPTLFDKHYEIVQGDVFCPSDLDNAMNGCDAVHISLSQVNDELAAKAIVISAIKNEIKLISIVSGCTVSEKNRWFSMIDNKFKAEQTIIKSGIPYMIFRPTWFFESLDLFVRDGKATMLGKQPVSYRWVAADDFARMVATAYRKSEAKNKIFYIFGPQPFLMKELLEKYCKYHFPSIKKVSTVPLGMIRVIATVTRNKQLKEAALLFAYFEKVNELGDHDETNRLLGKPEISFEKWLENKL